MGPSGGRHASDNIDAGIGGADLFADLFAGQDCGGCPLMYNYTVNRGGMWIIAM